MERLGPWPRDRRVAVGVSGGADSLCLAWLLKGWGSPIAYIVDHGLRPGSDEEAKEAVTCLTRMGIPARVITLTALHPGSGLAARARIARYAALEQAAVGEGLSDLLVGHHANDQAETVLMRGNAGSGPAGLAGMAEIVEMALLRLVRPLLGIPAALLRGQLQAARIGWSEDPGNSDGEALRSRLRQELGCDRARYHDLLEQAARQGEARLTQDAKVADTLARRATLYPQGFAFLTAGPIPERAFAALLRSVAGRPYPVRSDAVARLAADPRPATLGGVHLLPAGRLGDGLLLVREAVAMQPPVPALPGTVWDGRFRLSRDAQLPPNATLGAVGADAARLRQASHLPAAVLRTLPAIRVADSLLAVPHVDAFDCGSGHAQSLKLWTLSSGKVTLQPLNHVAGAPFAPSHAEVDAGGAERASAPHVA